VCSSDLPNSNFVKGMFGIDGRFTERISALAFVGLGGGFFSANSVAGATQAPLSNVDVLSGLLFKAQVKYAIVPATEGNAGAAVNVGYVKDFRSSFFTNFVAFNQVFGEIGGQFDRFVPSLRYELRVEDYEGAIVRHDLVNVVRGGVGFQAAKFATIDGALGYLSRSSSTDNIEYNDFQLNLGATFVY
jgi:hypothetical protein